MGSPPLLIGGSQLTVAWFVPAGTITVTFTLRGAVGTTATGEYGPAGADDALVPALLVAVTVKV